MSDIYGRETSYLAHHGVLGQKWGVRRYQNYDGSLISSVGKKKEKYTGPRYGKRRYKSKKKGGNTPLGEQMAENREKYDSKNYRVGEKRLNKRLNKLERLGRGRRDLKAYASASPVRQDKALARDLRKRGALDILEDPNKVEAFGKYTRRNRKINAAVYGGATAAALIAAGSVPEVALPAAVISAGVGLINRYSLSHDDIGETNEIYR